MGITIVLLSSAILVRTVYETLPKKLLSLASDTTISPWENWSVKQHQFFSVIFLFSL